MITGRLVTIALLLSAHTCLCQQEPPAAAYLGLSAQGVSLLEKNAVDGVMQSTLSRLGCFRLVERERIAEIVNEQAVRKPPVNGV